MERILYVLHDLNDGGAQKLVVDYCIHLDKQSFRPFIFALFLDENTANFKRAKENEITILSIFKNKKLFNRIFNKIFGSLIVSLFIRAIVKKIGISVIHINTFLLHSICLISSFLKKNNVKLFYTCHSIPQAYFSGNHKNEKRACEKLIWKNGLILFALHSEMKLNLSKMFNTKMVFITRNGINPDNYSLSNFDFKLKRESLGIPPDAYLIGHIGRFDAPKNHRFIVEVFDKVLQTNQNSFLLLVGEGTLKHDIQVALTSKNIHDKVKILSQRTDIPELLGCMDVFFFPSLYEGLSVTMIEAQTVGLKCVISNTINSETVCSNLVEVLDLNENISVWSSALLSPKPNVIPNLTIDLFDIRRVVKELEDFYNG